uniref:uncharacterized protein LOC122604424 n=1 Tax=Erigeron canadensis TaxID=72917 RepID=UPI001CB8E0E1|nr:uncharacterized protein LOC122604424 [Erigeron canadensis]
MVKNQSKLTKSLEGLTKAIQEKNEVNKSTLGQFEKTANKFTRDVTLELKNSTKSQTEFKTELVEISKSVKEKMEILHNDNVDLHRVCAVNNFRVDLLNHKMRGIFATPLSSFPGDDDKKGEKTEAEIEQEKVDKAKEDAHVADYLARLKERQYKARAEREAQNRRLVVFGSKEAEIKMPEFESGGRGGEEKEENTVEGQTGEKVVNVGEIRMDENDVIVEGKGKSTQSVPAQANPAPKEAVINSSSSEDQTTLGQYMMKKRDVGEGSSGVKVLTEEEKDWELAEVNAKEMGIPQLSSLESDPELAKALQEKINEEDKELAAVGSKKKDARKKRRRVKVHTTPSQKVKDVKKSVEAHAGWEAVDIKNVKERLNYRKYPQPIHQVSLKRRKGKTIPSIRCTREGYENTWETYDLSNVLDLGYTEWVELHDIIFNQPGVHRETILEALEKKFAIIMKHKIDISSLPKPKK